MACLAVILWLLAACGGGEAIDRNSSTSAVDQASGLPMGGPEIPNAPELVSSREALPYCGAEIIGFSDRNPYEFIDVVPGAYDCYRGRAVSGHATEVITVGYTIEGDPFLNIHRLMPNGREILFWDATQDKRGPMAWVMIECDRYSETGQNQCTDSVELDDNGS